MNGNSIKKEDVKDQVKLKKNAREQHRIARNYAVGSLKKLPDGIIKWKKLTKDARKCMLQKLIMGQRYNVTKKIPINYKDEKWEKK